MLLQVSLLTVLSAAVATADYQTRSLSTVHKIHKVNGPYTIEVPIANEFAETYLKIDDDEYFAIYGKCYLKYKAYFSFSCPVTCSILGCILQINLPEVSFLGQLTVNKNTTHYDIYDHQPDMCGQRRPVFTQERGPFIFSTLLPGTPWCVFVDDEKFTVDADEGVCRSEKSISLFKCNVLRFAEFSRLTVFILEIENISRILIGAANTILPSRIHWIAVEQVEFALSETRAFLLEDEDMSSSCINQETVEISWQLRKKSSGVNTRQLTCYSNEGELCGGSTPCVLEEKRRHFNLNFEVKRGKKRIVFFTCINEDVEHFDVVSYRNVWPGLDRFESEVECLHVDSNIVQLQWTVRSWSPREYRTLVCSMDNMVFCSGITTNRQPKKCNIEEERDTFTFKYNYERFGSIRESVFVCNLAADSQKHIVYWRGNGYEAFNEYIPEFIIPVESTALANALKAYLSHARIHAHGMGLVWRMSHQSNFHITCWFGSTKVSWLCTVFFSDAVMQLLIRQDTGVKIQEYKLNGKTYSIYGRLRMCAYNASKIGELEPQIITDANATKSFKIQNANFEVPRPIAALICMLSKGPKTICR